MQSRLVSTATRFNPLFLSLPRKLATAPLPTGRTADPAIYTEGPDGIEAKAAAIAANAESQTDHKPGKKPDPFTPPKTPYASSPNLESTLVSLPVEPEIQQKRRSSAAVIQDVSCAGLDGTPWPAEDGRDRLRVEEEDDKEYFQHHKASPLSMIEVADKRKPLTRVTDGTADSYVAGGDERVVLWRPEQLDTAEDSLRRATEIWKENATRGIPDYPHSRVLRALRGEDF